MSFHITQETFNEAVLENMECFSMTAEESIMSTIEQFRAQGVQLFGIITDPSIIGCDNPVKIITNKLYFEPNQIIRMSLINELKDLVKRDFAYKKSCEEFKVINLLFDSLLSTTTSTELKTAALEFFLVLFDGYPDLADEQICYYIISLLDNEKKDQIYGLKLIIVTCVKHEINRKRYIERKIDEKLKQIITQQPSEEILILVCRVVCTLTLDDDSRTDIPHAYNHACRLSYFLLKPFCRFLKVSRDPKTLRHILKAMTSTVVNFECCTLVEESGGLPAVMYILERNRDNEPLLTQCFKFLTSLTGDDTVKDRLMKFEIAQELHHSLNKYIHIKKNVNAALTLVSKISLRCAEYGKLFFKLDFPPLIIQALKVHSGDFLIQASGCWCIRNMCSRNPEYHNQFLSLGAEEILNHISKTNKCCSYDAKIALHQLGCEVDAREPWTGEMGDKLSHYAA